MYNWTDVVSVLITAGQVKYLFLSVQQPDNLPGYGQALYGSKVALLCLTQIDLDLYLGMVIGS